MLGLPAAQRDKLKHYDTACVSMETDPALILRTVLKYAVEPFIKTLEALASEKNPEFRTIAEHAAELIRRKRSLKLRSDGFFQSAGAV